MKKLYSTGLPPPSSLACATRFSSGQKLQKLQCRPRAPPGAIGPQQRPKITKATKLCKLLELRKIEKTIERSLVADAVVIAQVVEIAWPQNPCVRVGTHNVVH